MEMKSAGLAFGVFGNYLCLLVAMWLHPFPFDFTVGRILPEVFLNNNETYVDPSVENIV